MSSRDKVIIALCGGQLIKIEESLRRDFTDKFAGNFFRATEAMTNRVVNLEERQGRIEAHQTQIENRFGEYLVSVGATLDKAKRAQQAILGKFGETLDAHHNREQEMLTAMQAAATACTKATQATTDAAAICTSFVKGHQEIANTANQTVQQMAQEVVSALRAKVREIKSAAEQAMLPVVERVQYLTEAQLKRRVMFASTGFVLCLLIVIGTTFLMQQRLTYVALHISLINTTQSG